MQSGWQPEQPWWRPERYCTLQQGPPWKRLCAPKSGLRGRPSPSTAISDALALARRVEQIASMVSGLKAWVEAMETGSIAERFEVLWQRVLKLEESLERANDRTPGDLGAGNGQ